jgi:putative DNA primase/helicase
MDDRPWPTFSRGKPITQVQVGRMIRGFGIKSKNIRIKDKQAKGYEAADVGTALTRYAPAGEASQASQKINDNEIDELGAIFGTLQSVPEKDTDPSQASQTVNGHDEQGFDWANGKQENEVINEQWARIKAEHAARRTPPGH